MSSGLGGFATLEEAAEVIAAYTPNRPKRVNPAGLMKVLRQRPDGRWYWHWDPRFLALGREAPSEDYQALFAAACRNIRVPTLLVRGKLSDVVTDDGVAEFLAAIPTARLVDVGDAAHMVAGDQNDVFSNAVLDFLDTTSGRRRAERRGRPAVSPPGPHQQVVGGGQGGGGPHRLFVHEGQVALGGRRVGPEGRIPEARGTAEGSGVGRMGAGGSGDGRAIPRSRAGVRCGWPGGGACSCCGLLAMPIGGLRFVLDDGVGTQPERGPQLLGADVAEAAAARQDQVGDPALAGHHLLDPLVDRARADQAVGDHRVVWPMRQARSRAWSSTAGFHQRS